MRTITASRHAPSHANIEGDPAWGSPEAHLTEDGIIVARCLKRTLFHRFGIVTSERTFAASEAYRTQETGMEAGFKDFNIYHSLNEATVGLTREAYEEAKAKKLAPFTAIIAAEVILLNPPVEDDWVIHGLVMAGLSEVLGVHRDLNPVPDFCETRQFQI